MELELALKSLPVVKPQTQPPIMGSHQGLPLRREEMNANFAGRSKQETKDLANRVGSQLLGQFVKEKKGSNNIANRSLVEHNRLKDIKYDLTPTGTVAEPVPYVPQHGDVITGLAGDQTISDFILESLNGNKIGSHQTGGGKYTMGQRNRPIPFGYNSAPSQANSYQNKITDIAGVNGVNPERIYGMHMSMGRQANNFAQHFADANLKNIYSNILGNDYSREDLNKLKEHEGVQGFNDLIRNGFYNQRKKEHMYFKDFPGIENYEEAYLYMLENPEARKYFNNRSKIATETSKYGLPNGLDVEYAVSEPALRDMEIGMTGLGTFRATPYMRPIDDPSYKQYGSAYPGVGIGPAEVLMPYEVAFPDAFEHIMSLKRPQDFSGTIQKVFPHQYVDNRWLDQYNDYKHELDKVIKKGHFKDGGVAKAEEPSLDDMKYELTKKADGGSVESDQSLPLQAHSRRFTTPDYLDVQDLGVTGRTNDGAITLGRQIASKNLEDENPNMRFKQGMDYGQYSTPFHEGQLNARVMKNPEKPDVQAMLQYLQSVGKGTAGLGLMGNRTSEGDKFRALTMMYNQQIDPTSEISGMATLPFGQSPMFNVQYKKRFAEGGDVKKVHPALEKLIEEYVTNKKPNPARQTINEQLGRETIKLPMLHPQKPPTVGLGAGLNLEGNKAMPSSQMEMFKRKGGKVKKYALGGSVAKMALELAQKQPKKIIMGAERQANLAKFLKESKIKDRVYHGTNADIHKFDTHASELRGTPNELDLLSPLGTHFGKEPQMANNFAKSAGSSVYPVHINLKKPKIYSSEQKLRDEMLTEPINHYEVDRLIENPENISDDYLSNLTSEELGHLYDTKPKIRRHINEQAVEESLIASNMMHDLESHHDLLKTIADNWKQKNSNYDGIIYQNEAEKELRGVQNPTAYIAFEPTQIKSAIGNEGTFDPTNPELNKKNGGKVSIDEMKYALTRKR